MLKVVKSWTSVDKLAEYGPGPWENEPDKVQLVDEATGFDCLIVRNGSGALCGYVGVPEGHRFHGVGYQEVDTADCHGGLTFSDTCYPSVDEGHGICHVSDREVWWLGFDCAHYSDMTPGRYGHKWGKYRTIEYVKSEIQKLAASVK